MDMTVYHKTETAAKNEPAAAARSSKGRRRERRKNQLDRRRSVNEGVFVTLSIRDDRRSSHQERRQYFFVPPVLDCVDYAEPGTSFLDVIA